MSEEELKQMKNKAVMSWLVNAHNLVFFLDSHRS